MAKMEMSGSLTDGISLLQKENAKKISKALDESANMLHKELVSVYTRENMQGTGELLRNIKISKKNDEFISVYVKGKFNIQKAVWREYGTSNQIARPVWNPTIKKMEQKIFKLQKEILDE